MMGFLTKTPKGQFVPVVSKARLSCRSKLATQSNATRPFSRKLLVQVLDRLCPEGFRYRAPKEKKKKKKKRSSQLSTPGERSWLTSTARQHSTIAAAAIRP